MTVSCNICRGPFGDPDELEAHIAADHFSFLPYECEKCPYTKFPTETTIRHHCENLHNQTDYAVRYRISPEILRKRRDVQGALRESLSPEPLRASTEDTNTTAAACQASPVEEVEMKLEPTSDQEGMSALDGGPQSSGFDGNSTFDSAQLSSTTDFLLQKIDFTEEQSEFSNEQTTSTSADTAEMSMEVADSSAPSTSNASLWKALHQATYRAPRQPLRKPPPHKTAAKPVIEKDKQNGSLAFHQTQRGQPKLIHRGGYGYTMYRKQEDGGGYWKCDMRMKAQCMATAKTIGSDYTADSVVSITPYEDHMKIHPPDSTRLEKQMLKLKAREMAVSTLFSPQHVMASVTNCVSEQVLEQVKPSTMAHYIRRARRRAELAQNRDGSPSTARFNEGPADDGEGTSGNS